MKTILIAVVVGVIVAIAMVAVAKLLNAHIPMAVVGGVTGAIVSGLVVPMTYRK